MEKLSGCEKRDQSLIYSYQYFHPATLNLPEPWFPYLQNQINKESFKLYLLHLTSPILGFLICKTGSIRKVSSSNMYFSLGCNTLGLSLLLECVPIFQSYWRHLAVSGYLYFWISCYPCGFKFSEYPLFHQYFYIILLNEAPLISAYFQWLQSFSFFFIWDLWPIWPHFKI